ncbi:hypothetical protein TL16_g03735 [Triparma laevis f. inornata]|uniref:Enoyl-CoA hydratase domain-containing protein 3, mitochondrial n=1 Tax=Triparma laevis f. inornata TaxID=1714386 RepID=A0A9W7A0S2_9STRA|nr:hypothetical protein TL16_g03735 [Triparma laevis f. inornata]
MILPTRPLLNRLITSTSSSGIQTLTIDHPYSSLTSQILTQLHNSVTTSTAKCIVIKSSNPKFFCSGHDLKECNPQTPKCDLHSLFRLCNQTMLTIQNSPIPCISSVSGLATGAGLQIVLSSHLTVADEEARFQTPGVNLGLFCSTPSVPLLHSVERKWAYEMLLTGDIFGVDDAFRWGLVNRVSSDLELDTQMLADKIVSKSFEAIRIGLEGIKYREGLSVEEEYEFAGKVMVDNMFEYDAKEGISSFIEKRKPNWK